MPDAIVIGGGVMGLLGARELHRRGFDVTLVERDRPGRQASWASAGILTAAHPHDHSPESSLKRRSEQLYPGLVSDLKEETDIDAEMTSNGHLVPAFTDQQAREFRPRPAWTRTPSWFRGGAARGRAGAWSRHRGRAATTGRPDRQSAPGRALEVAVRRAGVTMVYGAAVTEILRNGNRVDRRPHPGGRHPAPVVVNAAGSWSRQIPGCDPVIPGRATARRDPGARSERGRAAAGGDQSPGPVSRATRGWTTDRRSDPQVHRLQQRVHGRRRPLAAQRGHRDDPGPGGGAHRRDLDRIPAQLARRPAVDRAGRSGGPVLRDRPRAERHRAGPGQRGASGGPGYGATPKIPAAPFDPRRFVGVEMPDPSTWGVRGGLPI